MPLFFHAYFQILRFEYSISRRNFAALYQIVRNYPSSGLPERDAIDQVCRAIDLACVFYPKQVLCLQRSAATTCLLRRVGVKAWLVVGARQLPFKAHAWVEVAGVVVNDKPYMSEIYGVLDRC